MDSISPPTAAELDRLREFFVYRSDEYDDTLLSTADGFIAAIAISPEFIAPREWLPALLGDFEEVFTDKLDEIAISNIAWRRHNQVLAGLQDDPPSFTPLLEIDTDDWPLGEIWAEGFLMGMRLRLDSWAPLLEDSVGAAMALPILALGDPDTLAEIEPRKAKRSREARRFTALITRVLPVLERMTRTLRDGGSLNDLTLPASLLEAVIGGALPGSKPAVLKASRNDPCPCGSGQKYKRCCGVSA